MTGLPARKPIGFTTNDDKSLEPLFAFVCDGSHQHEPDTIDPNLKTLRFWTWLSATAVADGACAKVRVARRSCSPTQLMIEEVFRKLPSEEVELEEVASSWGKMVETMRRM